MICNIGSKRINENNYNIVHKPGVKYVYMQIFMFVSVSVCISIVECTIVLSDALSHLISNNISHGTRYSYSAKRQFFFTTALHLLHFSAFHYY